MTLARQAIEYYFYLIDVIGFDKVQAYAITKKKFGIDF